MAVALDIRDRPVPFQSALGDPESGNGRWCIFFHHLIRIVDIFSKADVNAEVT